MVAGSKHIPNLPSAIPAWWGIIEAIDCDGTVMLRVHREPQINSNVDQASLIKFLWKAELAAILTAAGHVPPRSCPRHKLRDLAVSLFEPEVLARHVREQIKARGNWRVGPTPFRGGDSSRSSAKSRHSRARNRQWLLSRGFAPKLSRSRDLHFYSRGCT